MSKFPVKIMCVYFSELNHNRNTKNSCAGLVFEHARSWSNSPRD